MGAPQSRQKVLASLATLKRLAPELVETDLDGDLGLGGTCWANSRSRRTGSCPARRGGCARRGRTAASSSKDGRRGAAEAVAGTTAASTSAAPSRYGRGAAPGACRGARGGGPRSARGRPWPRSAATARRRDRSCASRLTTPGKSGPRRGGAEGPARRREAEGADGDGPSEEGVGAGPRRLAERAAFMRPVPAAARRRTRSAAGRGSRRRRATVRDAAVTVIT